MKIALPQLAKHLSKQLAPIYVISSDEMLLMQDALEMIREAALKAGYHERIRLAMEAGSDWTLQLRTSAEAYSLFSQKRIIELNLVNVKLNAATSKILQEYAANPSIDTILIIRIHKLDTKAEQSSWFKAMDKVGVTAILWPISLDQLPHWIMERAKTLSLTLTPAVANALAHQAEGNLLAAAQELEKLRLLTLTDTIDENTLAAIGNDDSHYDIFTLVDAVLAGNLKRSIKILDSLASEELEPTLILWAFTRELRTLAEMAKQSQQGVNLATLFSQFRIWEKRQAAVRAFLQRHNQNACWNFLVKAAEIDRMIKGAEKGNVWDELNQFTLAMIKT